ncbi:phosphotransferase [Actinomadura graeca]|uniref:Phosphotransferase n=1 Tax=Actinomadura graeca TaxID=2750812 RepID=A0ABX8R1F1_9ACTN|nr:phosphotransferase [Actinomadura graeca]QXJ24371.1 phosphotransferase [Actinomadura graeca]
MTEREKAEPAGTPPAGAGHGMATSGHEFIRPGMGTRNVLIPARSRRGALAGVSLITRSKTVALAAQWALYGAVAAFGTRVVPGPRVRWEPPGGPERWEALATRVGPFDGLALYERPQASRTGLAAVLLRSGRPVGFLKLRDEPGELDREERALSAFPGGRAEGFRVPRVLDRGETAGWHWMVIEAMPPRPARPVRGVALEPLLTDLQRRLKEVLPRPQEVPAHWVPMHGDLTAWNLRHCGPGEPWLIDWEDAAWAPPGADLVYYEATHTTVFGKPSSPGAGRGHAEAAEFWLKRVALRSDADHDAPMKARLSEVLRSLGPHVP